MTDKPLTEEELRDLVIVVDQVMRLHADGYDAKAKKLVLTWYNSSLGAPAILRLVAEVRRLRVEVEKLREIIRGEDQ